EKQVRIAIGLLEEGGTVPFIARYRKEQTGGMDEVEIANIRDLLKRLQDLDKRREVIIKSLQEQNQLSPEIHKQLLAAETLSLLEDIYLPFKPKRKTRASIAREKGLEELATLLLKQELDDLDIHVEKFVNKEKGVNDADEALSGARDIIAEIM